MELRDYTVLIESSVSEARALANLAEARKLVPNKPVRYHLNTHHHGDHAAGVVRSSPRRVDHHARDEQALLRASDSEKSAHACA